MMRFLSVFFVILFSVLIIGQSIAKDMFNHTGLPIPRFVSMISDDVNIRFGPGKKYPISWEYQMRNLPVEITAEFEHWRKIKDPDGDEGWVHKSLLTGKRHGFVSYNETLNLYKKPQENALNILQIEGPNIVSIQICKKQWCKISLQSFEGWVLKTDFYGVYPNETFN